MAHCTVIHPITCIKGGHATNQSLPSIQSPETGPDPEQSDLTIESVWGEKEEHVDYH